MAGKRVKKLVRRLGPPVNEENEGLGVVEVDEDYEPKRLAPNTTFATRLVSATERTNVRQQCAEPVQSTNRTEGEALIGRISALYGISVAIEPQVAKRIDARSILNRTARAAPEKASIALKKSAVSAVSEDVTPLSLGKKTKIADATVETSVKNMSGLMARLGAAPGTTISSTPELHAEPATYFPGAGKGGTLMSRLGSAPTKDSTITGAAMSSTSSVTPRLNQRNLEGKSLGDKSVTAPADGGGRKRSRSSANMEPISKPVKASVVSRLGAVSSNGTMSPARRTPPSGLASTHDETAKKEEPQQKKRFVPKGVGGHLLLARALGARSRE